MFGDLRDTIGTGLAALIGGTLSALVGFGYWMRLHKKVDDSAGEIKRLRDDSFAKLERDVKEHIAADKSQQVLTEVKNLSGQFSRMNDKIDALGSETARQGAEIKAGADYTSNLYQSIQSLRKEIHQK